jgi:hypothetical protein
MIRQHLAPALGQMRGEFVVAAVAPTPAPIRSGLGRSGVMRATAASLMARIRLGAVVQTSMRCCVHWSKWCR